MKGLAEIRKAVEVLESLPTSADKTQVEAITKLAKALDNHLQQVNKPTHDGFGLLGNSKVMLDLKELISKVSKSNIPVLITGENGTGKELIAKAIAGAHRPGKPFVAVNCGAITPSLLESELFGHVRGSFTGADKDKPGLFQSANTGTIFLDEIGETPHSFQVALLRLLQEGTAKPVGSTKEVTFDVRVLAATNRNLPKMIKEGTFREDLFYRLAAINIVSPALRDRAEDIPLLSRYFMSRICTKAVIPQKALDPSAVARLQSHSWPGNVRELMHCMERVAVLHGEQLYIRDSDLFLPREQKVPENQSSEALEFGIEAYLDAKEKELLLQLLEKKSSKEVADALKVSLSGLYKRFKRLGIKVPTSNAS